MTDNKRMPWSSNQTFMAGQNQLNIKVPNTKMSLYLYNINTRRELNITLIPDTLTEQYSQNIVKETPFGVLHPINFYVGGSPKVLSFSFTIHEDMIISMGIADTLYEAMDILKDMSMPKVYDGVYKEPLVYLQLGDQFAGKGHIVSGISYKKPFSNGRYKLADVNITFTFHEIFESDNINRLYSGNEEVLSSNMGMEDFPDNYDSVEDFYKENFDPQYIIESKVFSEERQNSLWDYIAEQSQLLNVTNRDELETEDILNMMMDIYNNKSSILEAIEPINSSTEYRSGNPWLISIIQVYAQYFLILDTSKLKPYSATVSDLIELKNAVVGIIRSFDTSYLSMLDSEAYDDWKNHPQAKKKGWYQTDEYGDAWIHSSDEVIDIIETEIEYLLQFLPTQISAYEFLSNKVGV